MKKYSVLLVLSFLSLGLVTSHAQFGGPGRGGPSGPNFGGATGKLFGEQQSFTATLEFQMADPNSGGVITMPGKISLDAGKSRFEMNMSDMKGSKMPAGAAEHMKAMGMDQMVMISRPDKKVSYMIYPGMQGYVENSLPDATTATADDFKVETTELGKETVDGHDCVKNKIVVTDKDGNKHESTVWNATDLKKFPIKIETNEQGHKGVMLFKDISLTKPDASVFEAPADFTKYTSMQGMMQEMMMKRMGGGGMGMPPH